jgi:uncharacterized membrane protein
MTAVSLSDRYPVSRWVVTSTFVLSLIGLGISIYLTVLHYDTSITDFCPNTGVINCGLVTSGPYSSAFGLPFALYGLAYFVAMAVLCSPWVWALPQLRVHHLRLLASATGIAMICYLIYIEFAIKHHICLWCTGVHVTTFAIFAILITNRVTPSDELSEDANASW